MKVSSEQVQQNRERVLAAAGRLIREHGFNGVCVAEVMKAAGLSLPATDLLLPVRMRQLR
jgi:TetR/AcrR family transcriptional repressor of nem operon